MSPDRSPKLRRFVWLAGVVLASTWAASDVRAGCPTITPIAVSEADRPPRVGCENLLAFPWIGAERLILLEFPRCNREPCAGAVQGQLDCLIEHGYQCGMIGDFISRVPGNHVGTVERGLQARFDSDSDTRAGCHADYAGNDRRILYLPVVKAAERRGSEILTIAGFAAFFLRDRPDARQPLELEYLYDVIPGGCPE